MSCCPQATRPLGPEHRMRVSYAGGRPVLIKGPVTGVVYQFSGIQRANLVDPRDAVVIARDRLFRIEAVVDISVREMAPGSGGEARG